MMEFISQLHPAAQVTAIAFTGIAACIGIYFAGKFLNDG